MLEERKEKEQAYLANFMVVLLILVALFAFFLNTFSSLVKQSKVACVITFPFFILFLFWFLRFLRYSIYPLSFYGLTFKNWQRSLFEGIVFTLPIILLSTIFKWYCCRNIPAFLHEPLLTWGRTVIADSTVYNTLALWITLGNLLISSPVQEIIFRGYLQSTLRVYLTGKHHNILALFTSNLIFAMIHLIVSLPLALLAFLAGLFWGWLYQRHGTLVGAIASHMIVGFWVFYVVGIQKIVF